MYTKVFLFASLFMINFANAMEKEHRIPEISLDGGFKLVPYSSEHIGDFRNVVNDPDVFPHIRHGGIWDDALIQARHKAYIEGNANDNAKYDPKTFLTCWVLVTPSNEIIGRGGFQPEDECQPVATEPFFAIQGKYQKQGLMKKVAIAMQDWFIKTVGPNTLLRCLTMRDNTISQHLAEKFGFTPRDNGNGQQLVITNWGKEYLVFEKNGQHDLNSTK